MPDTNPEHTEPSREEIEEAARRFAEAILDGIEAVLEPARRELAKNHTEDSA